MTEFQLGIKVFDLTVTQICVLLIFLITQYFPQTQVSAPETTRMVHLKFIINQRSKKLQQKKLYSGHFRSEINIL